MVFTLAVHGIRVMLSVQIVILCRLNPSEPGTFVPDFVCKSFGCAHIAIVTKKLSNQISLELCIF